MRATKLPAGPENVTVLRPLALTHVNPALPAFTFAPEPNIYVAAAASVPKVINPAASMSTNCVPSLKALCYPPFALVLSSGFSFLKRATRRGGRTSGSALEIGALKEAC
jgi:hypothetical protein